MTESRKITAWPGCDPQLAKAIELFLESWGPYSAESRRYSIFRLMRDLIDPAWHDLCLRYPALNSALLDHAWNRYQWEKWRSSAPSEGDIETAIQKAERMRRAFTPCGGKTGETYLLSEIARRHGFAAMDQFIHFASLGKEMYGDTAETAYASSQSLDSLRELALACRSKKSKKKAHGKVNARRENLVCRLCGQQTELSAHINGAPWPAQDLDDERLRLSSLYCGDHKPKAPFNDSVRPSYLKAKRNQSKFDLEFLRLERQSWGSAVVPRAKSGNKLVDEFICRLVAHRRQGLEFDKNSVDLLDKRLRDEARMLVDEKISDRKKEIVILLLSGLNQSEISKRLCVERQAISKALQSIPADYRLDLLCSTSESTEKI